MSLEIKQTIGNPGNPCWEILISHDGENIGLKIVDVDSKEEMGAALSPQETLVLIEALQLMFKVQQTESGELDE